MIIKVITAAILSIALIGASVFIFLTIDNESNVFNEIDNDENESPAPLGNSTLFKDAVNFFSFDLFKKLSEDPNNTGNLFYSPYSVFVALAMTYEGSKGQTAIEMKDVLNIEQNNESFHKYMKNLYDVLNKKNNNYNISTANALWIRENLQLLQEYLEIIRNYYGGDATELDYSKPSQSADIINQWVENQTKGLIKDLITPDAINPMTALILTNAIYFKGIWKTQFDPENTTNRNFKVKPDVNIDVPTMSIIETKDYFNYTETKNLQILELPYNGNNLSMFILLPKNNTNYKDLINTIDSDQYLNLINSMNEKMVDIYLPKFKVETNYQLNDYLQNLGMITAFSSNADFSGITGLPDLFISKVLHKAFIEINEEGTEAAAATAVIMEFSSIEDDTNSRIVFNVDHPFIYTIQHKETGTILFMGSVNNPLN